MFEIQVKIKHGHRAKNTKQTQAETQKNQSNRVLLASRRSRGWQRLAEAAVRAAVRAAAAAFI